jgi:hypothetical protein
MNSDGAWRPVTFPSLEAALSRNLVLQSVYFALGKREDEVAQPKCWVVLERTDEGADNTCSSYDLAILHEFVSAHCSGTASSCLGASRKRRRRNGLVPC